MKKEKQVETLLVIVLGLCTFYWITQNKYLFFAAMIVGVTGLLIPAAAKGIHWFWTKLSHALGFVSSRVLLTAIYIVVLLPLSFFAKRFAKTNIRLKPGAASYFKPRNHTYKKNDLENLW